MRDFWIRCCAATVFACLLAGCVGNGTPGSPGGAGPLRVSELDDGGDPRRGASLWALDRGLEYAIAGQPSRALDEYERAIQVDANNPYAYVAISRHYLELGDAPLALRNLDQAELLLGLADDEDGGRRGTQISGVEAERIQPHLDGLRGGALLILGREEEAQPLLDRARQRAPGVWGDGQLSAAEFR